MPPKSELLELQVVNNWNIGNTDDSIVQYLLANNLKGNATHIGRNQFSVTKKWSQYNPQKSYPKTDIIIGNAKISMKSANDTVLLAAHKNEAMATFYGVADVIYKSKIPSTVNDVLSELNKLVGAAVSPSTIRKAKMAKVPEILEADRLHQVLVTKLNEVFDQSTFKVLFVQEALAGNLKFGTDSPASANHILHITNRPVLHSLGDMNFISQIASQSDIRVDFKSSAKKGMGNLGQYRYWSIVSLINKQLIRDSRELSEDIPTFIAKSRVYVSTLISDIKNTLRSWTDIMEFLDVEPVIVIQ